MERPSARSVGRPRSGRQCRRSPRRRTCRRYRRSRPSLCNRRTSSRGHRRRQRWTAGGAAAVAAVIAVLEHLPGRAGGDDPVVVAAFHLPEAAPRDLTVPDRKCVPGAEGALRHRGQTAAETYPAIAAVEVRHRPCGGRERHDRMRGHEAHDRRRRGKQRDGDDSDSEHRCNLAPSQSQVEWRSRAPGQSSTRGKRSPAARAGLSQRLELASRGSDRPFGSFLPGKRSGGTAILLRASP